MVLADRSRLVDGRPTSLLGYEHAAIDDGWQECNSGPGGVGFHNVSGFPNVNTTSFPSMAVMTAKARSLGLKAGWCESFSRPPRSPPSSCLYIYAEPGCYFGPQMRTTATCVHHPRRHHPHHHTD